MSDWQLLSALGLDRISEPVRLFNPAWIDDDFNPTGTLEGYWQDEEGWIGAVWNAEQDCWDREIVHPTHFRRLDNPITEASALAAAEARGLERAARWHDAQFFVSDARLHVLMRGQSQRLVAQECERRQGHREAAAAIRALPAPAAPAADPTTPDQGV